MYGSRGGRSRRARGGYRGHQGCVFLISNGVGLTVGGILMIVLGGNDSTFGEESTEYTNIYAIVGPIALVTGILVTVLGVVLITRAIKRNRANGLVVLNPNPPVSGIPLLYRTYPTQSFVYGPQSAAYGQQNVSFGPHNVAYGPQNVAYGSQSTAYGPQATVYGLQPPAYEPQAPAYEPQAPAYELQAPAYEAQEVTYGPHVNVY